MKVSIVIPVFGNADTLRELHARLTSVCRAFGSYEILFVNDCGADDSLQHLREISHLDTHVGVVALHQNGGQNRAVIAGVSRSSGDRVVVMDADLQDPPEVVPTLLALLPPFDVVFAGRRGSYETSARLFTSRVFKRLLWLASRFRLPPDAGLFVAFTREIGNRIVASADAKPYVVGLLARSGGRMHSVPITRSPRVVGVSSYTTRARLMVALDALASVLRRPRPIPLRTVDTDHELIGAPFSSPDFERTRREP